MTTSKQVKVKKYKFHSDAGHGWLAVKIKDLVELNISQSVSPYSYMKGKTAYLEEDCDFSLFLKALKEKDISYEIVNTKSKADRSPIRGYNPYNHEEVLLLA